MCETYKDDPTAIYRGYRRQALYCLYRLFDDGLSENTIVQPEGNEDLEIRQTNGQRLEVVQVKDYSDNLTASDFKPSFYRRISHLCSCDESVTIKIASFGPIGPELIKAYDNDQETPERSLKTLTKDREEKGSNNKKIRVKGLSEREAKVIFERVKIEKVDEYALTRQLIKKLTATTTSGNPEVAFENLMWWLISSSEGQRRLTRSQTIEKLTQLGRFVSQRDAHAKEWNISIKPIEPTSADEEAREKLKTEFFQGGRVKAEHVAAGLDIPRDQVIANIHRAFQSENVAILRGASGQGKTTLAYRYLLDWAPSDFRFQIEKAADLEHARQMAAAIAGHAEIISVPSVIYIDVHPGDTLWVEFVRELSGVHDVRILVTIREEDWFRSRVSQEKFSFVDISLEFTKESGNQIFSELKSIGYGDSQLNFDEAWGKLGKRKTLFEFVYLITQNEHLFRRVQNQISKLKDEVNSGVLMEAELQLLRIVVVATAYEARLNLIALADSINIPEITRTLERFGNEYLLRTSTDGKYVEGFHAIRSEIIAEELTDALLNRRGIIESQILGLIAEEDLESFLLCSFSRNKSTASKVIQSLSSIQLSTWVGVRAVLIGLQWIGVKNYSEENKGLIKTVWSQSSSGWNLILDWDLAQIRGKQGFQILQQLAGSSKNATAAAASASDAFRKSQSDKNQVFETVRDWLDSFPLPTQHPDSIQQFVAIGEILYWLGHLGQQRSDISNWLDDQVISEAWEILPLHLYSQFAAGVFKFDSGTYSKWLEKYRDTVEERIRADATIIKLSIESDCLVAYFLIDINWENSDLVPSETETNINDLAVQRVEIISTCLPGHSCYGASGYGHRMSFFEGMNDDSTKRMPVENLVVPWLPSFNALATGSVEYEFRPNSWEEYFEKVRTLRENALAAFKNLRQILLKNGDISLLDGPAWNACKHSLNSEFMLPKSAVDEWGFVSESRAEKFQGSKSKKFNAILTLDPFNKALNEFTTSLGNFISQSVEAFMLIPNLRKAKTARERHAIIKKGVELGVSEGSIRLSVINGMDACIALRKLQNIQQTLSFDSHIEFDEELAKNELDEFLSIMQSWVLFCYPDQVLPNVPKQKLKRKRTNRRRISTLHDVLETTTNRISQSLKNLKKQGIDAQIVNDLVPWNDEQALWISFDTSHPLGSLIAIETLWNVLVEAFRPDRDKIVRIKVMDYFWEKIILLPLVQGCSLDGQAYANMKAVSYSDGEDPVKHSWRFLPEEIPSASWGQLGLSRWDHTGKSEILDDFASAYSTAFQHLDHIADFTRCEVDLDNNGQKVFLDYTQAAVKRFKPHFQKALDSCATLCEHFSEVDESTAETRPNLLGCMNLIVQMKDILLPSEDFREQGMLTINEMANWRNRLKDGLNLIGEARALWIADCLEFPGFDYPE